MISLTIAELGRMTKQDAAALRAIADAYYPQTAATQPTTRHAIAMLYKACNEKPSAPAGTSAYDFDAGANVSYTGRDGWSETIPTKVDSGESVWMASIPLSSVRSVKEVEYAGATIQAVAMRVGVVANSISVQDSQGKPFAFGRKPPEPTLAEQFASSVKKTAERVGGTATVKALDPADNPAVGAPDQHALADKVFSGGVAPTSEQNVTSHGSPELDADAAKLEAMMGAGAAGATLYDVGIQPGSPQFDGAEAYEAHLERTSGEPDPAVVFSAGAGTIVTPNVAAMATLPNVQSGTPIPPPLLPATLPTLPQPAADATSASLPPLPAPAPEQTAASDAAPTTSPVQTDSTGLPWDARIHASTKVTIANGTWKKRRGVEDSTVAEVEAQLRAAMAIPATTPPAPAAWPFPKDSSAAFGTVTPPPPPPPPAGEAQPPTFPTLMTFITERVGDKRLTQQQVTAAVQATGLESINLAMARPDLIPAIMAELQKVAP